jgi:hypothetical protein
MACTLEPVFTKLSVKHSWIEDDLSKSRPVSSIGTATRVRFLDGAGHFRCDWSWNLFYGHLHCTSALTCTEVSVPCESGGNQYW